MKIKPQVIQALNLSNKGFTVTTANFLSVWSDGHSSRQLQVLQTGGSESRTTRSGNVRWSDQPPTQ